MSTGMWWTTLFLGSILVAFLIMAFFAFGMKWIEYKQAELSFKRQTHYGLAEKMLAFGYSDDDRALMETRFNQMIQVGLTPAKLDRIMEQHKRGEWNEG